MIGFVIMLPGVAMAAPGIAPELIRICATIMCVGMAAVALGMWAMASGAPTPAIRTPATVAAALESTAWLLQSAALMSPLLADSFLPQALHLFGISTFLWTMSEIFRYTGRAFRPRQMFVLIGLSGVAGALMLMRFDKIPVFPLALVTQTALAVPIFFVRNALLCAPLTDDVAARAFWRRMAFLALGVDLLVTGGLSVWGHYRDSDRDSPLTDAEAIAWLKQELPRETGVPAYMLGDGRIEIGNKDAPALDLKPQLTLTERCLTRLYDARDSADFRYLWKEPDRPKLLEALNKSHARGYVTVVQPEFITDFTCEMKGKVAKGVVKFKAPELYEGAVEYEARKSNAGVWLFVEFHFPQHKLTLKRDENGGYWKQRDQ
jgi:hypothetical protein